jgi:hypothetical protein
MRKQLPVIGLHVLFAACMLVGLILASRFGGHPGSHPAENQPINFDQVEACLTPGFSLDEKFRDGSDDSDRSDNPITIRTKVARLRVHCENGVLYDPHGKKVYFYRGSEGGPNLEGVSWQGTTDADVARLRETGYHVIVVLPPDPPA